jgi:hypothetical protein
VRSVVGASKICCGGPCSTTPGVEDGRPVADATRALGVRVLPLEVRAPADYDSVFAPLAAKPIDGLVMFTDPLTWANWKRVADFAFYQPGAGSVRVQAAGGKWMLGLLRADL